MKVKEAHDTYIYIELILTIGRIRMGKVGEKMAYSLDCYYQAIHFYDLLLASLPSFCAGQ